MHKYFASYIQTQNLYDHNINLTIVRVASGGYILRVTYVNVSNNR